MAFDSAENLALLISSFQLRIENEPGAPYVSCNIQTGPLRIIVYFQLQFKPRWQDVEALNRRVDGFDST